MTRSRVSVLGRDRRLERASGKGYLNSPQERDGCVLRMWCSGLSSSAPRTTDDERSLGCPSNVRSQVANALAVDATLSVLYKRQARAGGEGLFSLIPENSAR